MSTNDTNSELDVAEEQVKPMLTTLEARIFGVLMEKQLTTPDAYPLTLNSLVLACNQKTNREPITNLESGEVQRCVSQLQDKRWIDVDYGTRAHRYDQRLTRVLGVDKATQAILNVMLLRGPQTLAELLIRTQRMFDFSNLEALEEKLEQLCAKTHPIIVRIPRQAGQREDRYMHLLCGQPDMAAIAAMPGSSKKSSSNELEDRVEKLEQQVAALQQHLRNLMDLNGVTAEDLENIANS